MAIKRTGLRLFYDEAQIVVDYETAIGLNQVAGHEAFRLIGRRSSLATTVGGDDIWEGAATNFVYMNQTVGEQLTLVSTHANDTGAGAGVQQVHIHGLRAGGVEAEELIVLSGVTPVHTVITDWIFNQQIHNSRITAGAIGTVAAGDITIYRYGDAARVYNVIKVGGNASLSTHRMVPNGKTFYMNHVKADAVDNKPVSVRLCATCDYAGNLTQGIFIFNEIFELYNSAQSVCLNIPRKFPSMCIIKGTAISSTAGGTCSLSLDGWVE